MVSEIGEGLVVLIGVSRGDGREEAEYLADRVANLRIFPDAEGRMNLSVKDVDGEVLVVSQFTLVADCRKGRRPSFACAAEPEHAERTYLDFVDALKGRGLKVKTGIFGAMMSVDILNWGPVTFILEAPREG